MIAAFIPARGGSKRLPGKNIKLFDGKPLLYYSIQIGREAPSIDRVIVSTDSEEISDVAASFGAEIIRRPDELAGDTATTGAAARHTVETLKSRGGSLEALVTLQPTNPLRTVEMVEAAIVLFKQHPETDSVISVSHDERKSGRIVEDRFTPDYAPGTRSQDMPQKYFENGLVYVSRAEMVVRDSDVFGSRIVPMITPPLFAMGDIDTQVDFDVAETLLRRFREKFPASFSR